MRPRNAHWSYFPVNLSQFASAEVSHDLLFKVIRDAYGPRLALVFGNHARGGICPYYAASLCHHCDIGRGEGVPYDVATNRQRLNWYRSVYAEELPTIAHLVIYNSGSVLNSVEMPFEFLSEVLAMARGISTVKEISLDSRESYVTADRLLRIAEQLRPDQRVRIIVGIESADEHIRNELLQKRMPIDRIQRAFAEIATAAEQIGLDRFGVDINILVGGPGTTDATAACDAGDTASFAMTNCLVPVDFNLHPYYRSARGSERFPSHKRCSLKLLIEALVAVNAVLLSQNRRSRIFIGLNDEGHDSEGQLSGDLESAVVAIRAFNATQDMTVLQSHAAGVDRVIALQCSPLSTG